MVETILCVKVGSGEFYDQMILHLIITLMKKASL